MSRRLNVMSRSALSNGSPGPEQPEMDAGERADFLVSIDRGIAELDAGLYVSGAAVDAWAKSLFTADELPLPAPRRRGRA